MTDQQRTLKPTHKWEGLPVQRYRVTECSPEFEDRTPPGTIVVHTDVPDGDHGPGTRTWSFVDRRMEPTGWFTGVLVERGTIHDGKFVAFEGVHP